MKNIISKVYLFPGQGSQSIGMGDKLFDKYSEIVNIADNILGYSVKELCLNDADKLLNTTEYTQPALFIVNYLYYLESVCKGESLPDYLAGHSLGEYTALCVAGAFDFEVGLKLVKKRGELMASFNDGGMLAVIKLNYKKIESLLIDNKIDDIDIANINQFDQIILSGPNESLQKAATIFLKHNAITIPLNVSGAFHSRYMKPIASEFQFFLENFNFKILKIPVISNVTAKPYDITNLIELLTKQLYSPVQWLNTIIYLMKKNISEFSEIGPGTVLTKIYQKIMKEELNNLPSTDDIFHRQTHDSNRIDEAIILGSQSFILRYKLKYPYVAGAMYKGISSTAMVTRLAAIGCLSFFGTGGLSFEKIEASILKIKSVLINEETFGLNFLHSPNNPQRELKLAKLLIKHKIQVIEASAFLQITKGLVLYRIKGVSIKNNTIELNNRIILKLSRLEVVQNFLEPIPQEIIEQLLEESLITLDEAAVLNRIPLIDDIVIESDSGGHTDKGHMTILLPAVARKIQDYNAQTLPEYKIHIGAAGGIGTPEAAATAFLLGADFIVTGSINQCTPESGISDIAKVLLQDISIHDTTYVPASDMFESGSRVQVVKYGVLFPARANLLYECWKHYESLEDIPVALSERIEKIYFKRSFEDIYDDVINYFNEIAPAEIERANNNPKYKMSLIFRWYLFASTEFAIEGNQQRKVDFQIQCGPSLGAFNQWVAGTIFEKWNKRHVDEIAIKLLSETETYLRNIKCV